MSSQASDPHRFFRKIMPGKLARGLVERGGRTFSFDWDAHGDDPHELYLAVEGLTSSALQEDHARHDAICSDIYDLCEVTRYVVNADRENELVGRLQAMGLYEPFKEIIRPLRVSVHRLVCWIMTRVPEIWTEIKNDADEARQKSETGREYHLKALGPVPSEAEARNRFYPQFIQMMTDDEMHIHFVVVIPTVFSTFTRYEIYTNPFPHEIKYVSGQILKDGTETKAKRFTIIVHDNGDVRIQCHFPTGQADAVSALFIRTYRNAELSQVEKREYRLNELNPNWDYHFALTRRTVYLSESRISGVRFMSKRGKERQRPGSVIIPGEDVWNTVAKAADTPYSGAKLTITALVIEVCTPSGWITCTVDKDELKVDPCEPELKLRILDYLALNGIRKEAA